MANKSLLIFLALEALFLATGGLLVALGVVFRPVAPGQHMTAGAAIYLLLQHMPLTGAIANAAFIFLAVLLGIPGILQVQNRALLRIHVFAVIACAIVSLVVGLIIWISTLQARNGLGAMWMALPSSDVSALQAQFNCCGYFDALTPPFVQDATCTSPLAAARFGGCLEPFSSFADGFLDIIFTAMFGLVGIDVLLILSTLVLIKQRDERERYQLIDEKSGVVI